MNAVTVRGATVDDLPGVSALAEALVDLHHGFDPRRFLRVPGVAEGYLKWFGRELENPDAVILVATGAEGLLGYLYGRVEARDWNMLLDRHGALHDIYVTAEARGRGVAEALIDDFAARVKALGVPRVVLHTASQNEAAQRLFARLGFRPTMIEMTREL